MAGSTAITSATPSPNMSLLARVKQLCHDICGSPSVSLSKSSGGSLSAGTVNVRVSVLTEFGESVPVARQSIAVLLNDKVTVTISRVPQARGYRVYASTGSNTETYQSDVGPGSGATVSLALSAIATGTAMPTSDTATVHIPSASYDQAVTAGLLEYSRNHPVSDTETIAMVTGTYDYDLPAKWDNGISSIQNIEYPSGENPKAFLDLRNVYLTGDGHWRWTEMSPTSGYSAVLHYTRPAIETEIPAGHFDAVAMLCAAIACETIATKYAHESNAVIGADSVDYKMRAADFERRAKVYREHAWTTLGTPGGYKPRACRATWGWKEDRSQTPEEQYKTPGQLYRS